VEAVEWMLDHEQEARQMGLRAQKRIEQYANVETSAAGVASAILSVLELA
jgi:hypothetical protein